MPLIALIAIGSFRIASTYKVFNFTIDEPAHAACGIEWLEAGNYNYEDQHPPLARVVGAAGLKVAGRHWDGDTNMWMEGFRLLGGGRHGDRGLVFGRAAMLPFFWIASTVVFLWARRVAGLTAALCATALYTTLAPVLGHAGLITTDMALTAFCGLAFLMSLRWAEQPSAPRTILFGISLGLATLTKFSFPPFFVAAWTALVLWNLMRSRQTLLHILSLVRVRAASFTGALLIAALVVWAGYLLSWEKVAGFPFIIPAPEFFSGIQSVLKHNAEGHSSYLLGRRSTHGFWYYYPVALTAKAPVAFLVILLMAIAFRRRFSRRIAEPMAYSLGILAFASFSRINIGVRHVLPIYTGAAIVGGVVMAKLLINRDYRLRLVATGLLLAHVISTGLQHPNYLSYINEFWWAHPERVLADSDVDWGQDMKRTAEKLNSLHVEAVHFEPFNRGYIMSGQPFPKILPVPDGDSPPPGWTAVSISVWKINGGPRWLDTTAPTLSIGKSILLFHR